MAEYIKFKNKNLQDNDLYLEHWLVNIGDFVNKNQQVASVRNGNRIYIVRAPIEGFLANKYFQNNEKFSLDENLGQIVTEEEASKKTITDTISPIDIKILKQINRPEKTKRIRKPVHVKASPSARNKARKNNINLEEVVGTGPDGRIQLRDVNLYIYNREHPVKINRLTNKSIQYGLPLTGIARRIARKHNLDSSKIPAPPNAHRIRRQDVERYLRNPKGAVEEIEKEYNIFQLSDLENPIVSYSDLAPVSQAKPVEETKEPEVIRLPTEEESSQETGEIIYQPQIYVYPEQIESSLYLLLEEPSELNENVIRLVSDIESSIPSGDVIILSSEELSVPQLMDLADLLKLTEPEQTQEEVKPIRLPSEKISEERSEEVINLEQTGPVISESETSKVPKASKVSKASKVPSASSVPKSSKVPNASRVPKSSKVPKGSPVPKASKVSKTSKVPKASKIPSASKVPGASRVPKSSKVPKASPVPKATKVSKQLQDTSLKTKKPKESSSLTETGTRLISKLMKRNKLSQELKNSKVAQVKETETTRTETENSKSNTTEVTTESKETETTIYLKQEDIIDLIQGLTGSNAQVLESELDSIEDRLDNINTGTSNLGHLSTLVNLNLLKLIGKYNPPVDQIGTFSKNYILSTIYYVFNEYFGSSKPNVYYLSNLKENIITSYSSYDPKEIPKQLRENQMFYNRVNLEPGDLVIVELLSYNLSSVSNIIDTDKKIVLYLTYIKNLDDFTSKDLGISSILEVSLDFDTNVLSGVEAIEFIEGLRKELEKLEVHE